MMNNDSTALLDVTQVATMAGLHRATVFKLVSAGKFPKPVKLGGATRWSKAELIAWDRREVSAPGKIEKKAKSPRAACTQLSFAITPILFGGCPALLIVPRLSNSNDS